MKLWKIIIKAIITKALILPTYTPKINSENSNSIYKQVNINGSNQQAQIGWLKIRGIEN